jgi:hypothetical protein
MPQPHPLFLFPDTKEDGPCLSGPLVVACRKKHANFDREAQDTLGSMVIQPPSPPFSDARPCSPHSSGSALLSHGTDVQGLPVRAHALQFLQPACIFVLLRTYPSPNMSNSSPAILNMSEFEREREEERERERENVRM